MQVVDMQLQVLQLQLQNEQKRSKVLDQATRVLTLAQQRFESSGTIAVSMEEMRQTIAAMETNKVECVNLSLPNLFI